MIFPTGAQVDIVRNYWGIDVTIITQRAKSRNDESGICLYEKGSIQSYGEQQRYWLQSKQYVLLCSSSNFGSYYIKPFWRISKRDTCFSGIHLVCLLYLFTEFRNKICNFSARRGGTPCVSHQYAYGPVVLLCFA